MRRVIVNSTPLIALCNADLLNILKEIYGSIIIPKQYSTKLQQKRILPVYKSNKILIGLQSKQSLTLKTAKCTKQNFMPVKLML